MPQARGGVKGQPAQNWARRWRIQGPATSPWGRRPTCKHSLWVEPSNIFLQLGGGRRYFAPADVVPIIHISSYT